MTTKETLSEQCYAKCIEHASSALKLSLLQVKEKYSGYPIFLIDYVDTNFCEKSIEIRIDKEEVTLTCTFDEDENCKASFLFPDNDELIEEFVGYLTEHHDYSFVRSHFMLANCYLKVEELDKRNDSFCLVFYR